MNQENIVLNMKFAHDVGPIHFVGIGGIGMSGIARVLANLGYQVQGSDIAESANLDRLREKGIQVAIGHSADALGEAQVVVVSSAIKANNPELVAARERFIPVVRRAEMLAELMRFRQTIAVGGTHGKTTTTSLVGTLLESGHLDPTVINGGIINAYGTNARLGAGDWMVVEADESDGTFIKLPADIVIVTNLDPEHMDHYGSFDDLRAAFRTYVENVPFYGFAVMCSDHSEVQTLIGKVEDRRIVTYGANSQADVQYSNRHFEDGWEVFDITFRDRRSDIIRQLSGLRLPMPGEHNVSNATAAVAVATRLGIQDEDIRSALAGFSGVKRRFTHTGTWNDIAIFDDYGHHPAEILAVLRAARSVTKNRVVAVMQPHRYSRLASLFDDFCGCFNDADSIIIADVFAAGEQPIDGANRDMLVSGIRTRGHRDVLALEKPEALAEIIESRATPGDVVICLGAGSITHWAYALPEQLKEQFGDKG